MSESAREPRPQFGFLSAVGLFFLAVLAVLVALYFYNADIRQAGDGAMSHAQAYKRTVMSDYSRFYECMRGVAPASSPPVKAESGRGIPGAASNAPSAPVVVYPPYADYPTYPGYQDGAAGPRSGTPPDGLQASIPGQYGAPGPDSRPPENAGTAAVTGPSATSTAPPSESQIGFAMQPGPMMSGGPGMQPAPAMEAGTGPEPQGSPSMQPGPAPGPGPMMQAVPALQPGQPMQSGPGMLSGPAGQTQQGVRPMAGMYGGRPLAQGYPPPPPWQGAGVAPSGMPPSGMAAPMPYGQGYARAQPPQGVQGSAMPGTAGTNYGMPPAGPSPYGPQGAMPRPPWSRYGYGNPGSEGVAGGDHAAPTVIPATPTMPMTSMMPPPGDAVPVLPAEAGQVDPQIAAARQAAASQQHQDAIRLYRGYISRNANDPSAFGELGNVLLSAGRPQEAAQAYYEASSRLIDVGQPGTVYLLLPHIEQHDPLLGAVLMRRLASLPRSIY